MSILSIHGNGLGYQNRVALLSLSSYCNAYATVSRVPFTSQTH